MALIKKIFRVLLVVMGALALLVIVLMLALLVPQDRSIDRTSMITEMQRRISSLDSPVRSGHSFAVGYARENLTPPYLTSTAGYGNRLGKKVTSVHDSIYVRCMVIDNGITKVAIVSLDMLLVPPEVMQILEHELPTVGFTVGNTYFGATHSHNSIGNWSHGAAMKVMYGGYDDSLVQEIVNKILLSVKAADSNKSQATLSLANIPVADAVRNRINRDHPVDSLLRVVRIERVDGSKLLLLNFTAHATCLSDGNMVLSGDYPGRLTQSLEESGYEFAMFMAGAVGSHGSKTREREWSCVEEMAEKLAFSLDRNNDSYVAVSDTTLWSGRVQLELNDAQFKVFKTWRLRTAAFNGLMGDYPEYVNVLRIGNLIMLGAPCDFSGEFYPQLDSAAHANGLQIMVTSFNGGYIGYVTPAKYYDEDHYETQLMNWYGPGTGEYLVSVMEMLLARAKDSR